MQTKPVGTQIVNDSGVTGATVKDALNTLNASISSGNTNPYFQHANTISTSFSVASGMNAFTVGPMTLANGATITVNNGGNFIALG